MKKIELLDYSKNELVIKGFVDEKFDNFSVYCGKKLIFNDKLNEYRPDVKLLIKNYDSSVKYGFNFKISHCPRKFKIFVSNVSNRMLIYKTHNYFIRRKLSKIKKILLYFKSSFLILWKDYHFIVPPKKIKEFLNVFYRKIIKGELNNLPYYDQFNVDDYNKWLIANEKEENIISFKYNPKISIIIPVYNVDGNLLSSCLESVLGQTYKNYEICIADDCSTNFETLKVLKEYQKKYKEQIKVVYRKENGHISSCSNSALDIATGDFVGLLDNDDILSSNALYEVVKSLNDNSELDFIYSDEDKIDLNGNRCDPHFKPDFSIDTLYSHNYICHFSVIRKSLIDLIGGFRVGYEGSQDYDLFLRLIEKTKNIHHIPKILYHWRMIPGSTSMEVSNKSYASINGIKALEDMLNRNKIIASVTNIYTSYIINYKVIGNPLVSIIIPTRDRVEILKNCIESIFNKTLYKNYEIIIVDNGSKEESTLKYFSYLKNEYDNISIISVDCEFNYSYLNNEGVKVANGDYLVLLNNDIEIISEDWLDFMLGYAQQEHIGCVGPKLILGDGRIQHAGVVTGVGEGRIANHAFYLQDRYSGAPAGRLLVPYNYSCVTGACIMIKKSKYLGVNGLNEKLAVNYNDVDFCLKILENGYKNVVLPNIELYHLESVSRGKVNNNKKYQQLLNEQNYMKNKWGCVLENDIYYNINYSKDYCFKLDK